MKLEDMSIEQLRLLATRQEEALVEANTRVMEAQEIAQAANRQAEHWKANHGDVVARLKIATERPDLAVDRIPAIKELERLQALVAAPQQHAQSDAEEDAHVIMRQGQLLAGVAIALKGEENARGHSNHDLPELATKMMVELEVYRQQHAQAADETIQMPSGLNREQTRAFIISHAQAALSESVKALPHFYREGVENGGYVLTTDVLRVLATRQPAPVASTPGVEVPNCRMQGGICACRSGGSYGGCAIERQAAGKPLFANAPQPAVAPVAFVPGGLQALVDMTGQPAMYGDTEVLPKAALAAPKPAVEAVVPCSSWLELREKFEAIIRERHPSEVLAPHPKNPYWYALDWVHKAWLDFTNTAIGQSKEGSAPVAAAVQGDALSQQSGIPHHSVVATAEALEAYAQTLGFKTAAQAIAQAALAHRAASKDSERDAALREAVGKLIKAKGRFHTEQNYAAVVSAYDAAMAAQQGEEVACEKCGDVLPPGIFCKSIGCPLNPAVKGGA